MARVTPPTEPTAPNVTTTSPEAPGPGDGWGAARRIWQRVPDSLREALLPFAVARVVVVGTLGLAHFIVDRTHPSVPGTAARVHAGLLGWDAGWYETIARQGYGALGASSCASSRRCPC